MLEAAIPWGGQVMPTDLGQILAEARAGKEWSLREVERRTGIQNAHLSQIETGAIERPAPHVLWTLAHLYGLDYHELLRASGHVEDVAQAAPGAVVGQALRTMGTLTPDQQREVLKFIKGMQRKGRR
jgi:HTH-type transcriptional regulator, competence development regulator